MRWTCLNLFIQKDPVILARNLHRETSLPVLAVDPAGCILESFGAAERSEILTEQLIRQMALFTEPPFHAMTLTDASGNHYTASYIHYCRKNRGFLLVGPYSGDIAPLRSPLLCQFDQLDNSGEPANLPCAYPLCQAGLTRPIRTAIDFTLRSYPTPITVTEAAAAAGINRTYFCTLFKQETELTWTQFLNMVRIEEARELLTETSQSILDIALAVGYSNQNYFSIQFRKLTGLTAGEYRRQHAGQAAVRG